MITILYTYRDKDLTRIKNSLLSLQKQTMQSFDVLFIDYGSTNFYREAISELLKQFPKISYHYSYVEKQPWSRAKAINIGIKLLKTPYVFVADIDMVFKQDFIEKLLIHVKPNQSTYFKVGFLDKQVTDFSIEFESIPVAFESEIGAQGLSLFAVQALNEINGFDEFYHFWGAEDADIHIRLQNAGYEVFFYKSEILMLHQWHPSYRSEEQKKISQALQLSGVVQLNHQHLKDAIAQMKTKVNETNWGYSISQQEYNLLQTQKKTVVISNKKEEIEHFLYFTLKQNTTSRTEYLFQLDPKQNSLKQRMKKIFRKKVPLYYSLKQINDLLFLNLISSPELKNYAYQVAPDLKSISLTL